MKDYSVMSDFEINCHVAEKAGIGDSMFFSSDESELAEEDPKKRGPIWNVPSWIQVKSWMPSKGNCFNPCNKPADAWPIITANHIGIMPFKSGGATAWPTSVGLLSNAQVKHENPLRCAMIVYLQMMEQK